MQIDIDALGHLGAAAAAFVAGGVNAVAGGGTLITFPALLALGVPGIAASATNTVALSPGYFGGAYAQRGDLKGREGTLRSLLIAAAGGGLAGSILLVVSSDRFFSAVVPFLILAACALLGFQARLRKVLKIGQRTGERVSAGPGLTVGIFLASVYGGYFGAGVGIMMLAVMGVLLHDPLRVINAMKSALSLVINVAAACFLVFSGKVVWSLVVVMAVASLAGGLAGGKIAGRLDARVLRAVVITFGVIVALKMLLF